MNKMDLVAEIASWIVASGTTIIVKGIIDSNVQTKNAFADALVFIAGIVIASMAKNKVKSYTKKQIQLAVAKWHQIQANIQTA